MDFLKLIPIWKDFIDQFELLIKVYLTYSSLSALSEVDWREAT